VRRRATCAVAVAYVRWPADARGEEFAVDPVVVVSEDDAKSGYVSPRDLGEPVNRHVAQRVGSLTDDLQQPFRSPTEDRVVVERGTASVDDLL